MKKTLLLIFAFIMTALYPSFAQEPDYLCFTAEESNCSIQLTGWISSSNPAPLPSISLQYRLGEGEWNAYSVDTPINLPNEGDKAFFRATSNNIKFATDDYNLYYFEISGATAASGNVMSLLDCTCTQTSVPDYAFAGLFIGCEDLTSAPSLPAITLGECCYQEMFSGCTNLTEAPELPATEMKDYCYEMMFYECENLTEAPTLSATTLADWCYEMMFAECISLTKAPELPATELKEGCYSEMFEDCSALLLPPTLPATTLVDWCYDGMFYGCSRLISMPELCATEMMTYCYGSMFRDCTSLHVSTSAPGKPWNFPIVTETDYWNYCMFDGTANEFTLSSGTIYYINSANADVTLNSQGYATYSTPHDAKISTAGVKAYKASVTGETITLTELEGDYIPGGTGILLYGEGLGGSVVSFDRVFSGSPADVSGNDLKATTMTDYSLTTAEANTWALGDGKEFLSFTGSEYIHNRAYLVHSSPSSAPLRISGSAEATGISTIDVAPEKEIIYTLDGQRANGAVNGLFIQNGKKLIIK